MIKNGECGAFNPKLIECFLEAEPVIRNWYISDEPDEMFLKMTANGREGRTVFPSGDHTEEGDAVTSISEFMLLTTALQNVYDLIISVNLTKNTYFMMDYNRFLTHCADPDGVFDELIEAGASAVPVSHRKEFIQTFCRESLLKAFYEGRKSVRLEHPQYGDDGTIHWVETKVLFMEDVRTGDVLEITLSQYIDAEHEQREKTRKILTDALNLAEQANNAKFDFLSKMSHDIRTPLNAIIGMTTIIAAHLDDQEKIEECLTKIGTSSRHLLGIINDVLDYSKIENDSLSLNIADFNLRDMITDLANTVTAQAKTKQHSLSVYVDEAVGNSYLGDEYRIRQILNHLFDNAYKYTPVGGSYKLEVSISRHTNEYDMLRFTVEDKGIGIRKEFLDRVFEPFAQDAQNYSTESIGLGLAISQNLVHLMNGTMAVVSEYGSGSSFTFEIPLERGNLTAYSEMLDTDIHVLVVDDDLTVCEHTAILLHDMGITAQIADNGFDAVKLVKANVGTDREFDVAIVDWKMPEMDGIETVRQIRQIAGRNVLVVVMSAYDWSDIEEDARAAGVDLFIAKPILESNLRTAIACSEKMLCDQTDISFEGQKVLIAEDNEFNSEVAKAILEMKNLTVDIAANGKAAYEMFTSAEPGEYLAILMDIMMPIMDGHEATRAIRSSSHEEAQTIPIYAMTANAFHNDILEAKLAGMNGHISKPVDFDEVARLLHTIVQKRLVKVHNLGGGYTDGRLYKINKSRN